MRGTQNFYLGIIVLTIYTVAVLILGFIFLGNPISVKNSEHDLTLSNSISSIASSIDAYYSNNQVLPSTLDAVGKYLYGLEKEALNKVGYSVLDTQSYQLCGVFLTEVSKDNNKSYYYGAYPDPTIHGTGRVCFEYDVSGLKLPK